MNFIDRITGNDMTRQMKVFEERKQQLPQDFQAAYDEMTAYMLPASNLTGRNLMPLFDQVLDLLELAVADGESLEELFGEDWQGFCDALTADEKKPAAYDFQEKCRQRLNQRIAKKLGGGKHA